ncbi:MAG: Nitroreductase [Candidatus Methanomarinus sp.]|nr:Nitroreductase [ANME-2 cluster archaeon]KAF5425314.1 MAG: Nitroreductase [ANME-2 cluster archaeon]
MENNQILDTIRSRKSVREFTDQVIEDTTISNILEAGRQAPSGLNNQPWCFIIVKDKITLNSIAKCTKYSSIIHGAPLLIVVMLDKNVMYDQTKDTQACGAAIENMLLAAHGMGLGAVWLGEILNKKEDVNHILEVPDSFELMAVIAIGHAVSDISHPKGRRELSEIAHNEKFGIPWV